MPKEFPQIRLNGIKEIAVGHVKRGMLELFKTQAFQKLANVPIAKRTVEVDPSTTITVQIAEEQTFIDITSTGFVTEVEEEEIVEEVDAQKCPAAFIIRKQDWEGHDIARNPGMEQVKGYIIAYNRLRDKWGIASFTGPDGDTFAHGSNLGWWHARNSGSYSACDVITWNGQSNFDFNPCYYWPTAASGYSAIETLTSKIFFQGREFDGPPGSRVMGACIINDGGADYLYVHALYVANEIGTLATKRVTIQRSQRMTLGAFLSNGTDWEIVGESHYDDFNIVTGGGVDYFSYPRSSAYIDENGFSYVILTTQVQHLDGATRTGSTMFLKYNLRDMSVEILNTTEESAPARRWGGDWTKQGLDGGNFKHGSPGAHRTGYYQLENLGRPWIFYMLGGTQNLWTYGLEWDLLGHDHSVAIDNDDFALDIDTNSAVAGMNGSITVIVYKDLVEHERIPILEFSGQGSGFFGQRIDDPDTDLIGSSSTIMKAIFEHHPDIDNSLRSGQVEFTGGGVTRNIGLNEDGIYTDFISESAGLIIPVIGEPGHFYIWTTPRPFSERMLNAVGTQNPGSTNALGSKTEEDVAYPNVFSQNTYSFSLMDFDGGTRYISRLWNERGTSPSDACSIGTDQDNNMVHKWGSSQGFHIPRREGSSNAWPVEAFAIHRPTDTKRGTKKPYLHLRRPIKNGTQAGKILWEGVTNIPGNKNFPAIWIADKAPATYDTSIADTYDQATQNGASIGDGLFSRKEWWFWTEPLGHLMQEDFPPPDFESGDLAEPAWKDDDWTLESNVLTAKQLNALTREMGNAFFEIGVL